MNFKALFKVVGEIIKGHAPEICAVAGTGLMIGGAVLAAKGTLAIDEVLDEHKENMEKISKGVEEDLVSKDGVHYSELAAQDKALTWKKTILGFTKAYGPALACEVGGALLVFSGFKCLRKRNIALAGALTSVTEAFNKYRSRVIAEEGKLNDMYYRTGRKTAYGKYVKEDGSEEDVMVVGDPHDPIEFGAYSYLFDETTSPNNWQKRLGDNLLFVTCVQNQCNDWLHGNGYLFLNEVLRALGMDTVDIGQDVGWVLDEDGNGSVDFGIAEILSEYRDHIIDDEDGDPSFWIELNCQGYIRDKIWKASKAARKGKE